MRSFLFAVLSVIATSWVHAGEAGALPDWMRPGARVTYFQGSASIQTSGQILVLDDKGNWVNIQGQKFAEKDNPGAGGGGFFQLTILAADPQAVAAETRTFVLSDPQAGRVTLAAAGALVGTSAALSDYWLSPAALAAKPDTKNGGLTVRRMPYPLRGHVYNAIVIEMRSGISYERKTYDLETGLLLASSTSSVGTGGYAPNPNGTSTLVAGATTITSTMLADLRQLRLPWLSDPRPESIARGTRINYDGTYTTTIPGSPEVSQSLSTNFVFGEPRALWAPARFSSSLMPLFGGRPQESVADRAMGAATTLPMWIQPQTISRLAPGTVVDDDPVTHFRTTYLGVFGGLAVVVEEGPYNRSRVSFDMRTGMLAAEEDTQQIGIARTQVRVQRVPDR
jgi:hypothetical protein